MNLKYRTTSPKSCIPLPFRSRYNESESIERDEFVTSGSGSIIGEVGVVSGVIVVVVVGVTSIVGVGRVVKTVSVGVKEVV